MTGPGDAVLQLRDIRKRYGKSWVLRGIDLTLTEGTATVLIGASGSGKSTLLRCVNLLETIDDGQVLLDGDDISEVGTDPDEVRQRIGVVFQAFNLVPHLSVLSNITLAPRRVHKMGRGQAEQEARELLERFGLADKADTYPDRLSGGQQQRVAIVRALAAKPRLLLLDEVTSALDPELVGEVLALVAELRSQGMTMLIASHEMGFVREIADHVVFLDAGTVCEQGPPTELLARPREERTRAFLSRIL